MGNNPVTKTLPWPISMFAPSKPIIAQTSTLRTVTPSEEESTNKPVPAVNVIRLIDENIPLTIERSDTQLKYHLAEAKRLAAYIDGLKKVQNTWKEADLVSLSKPTIT